jgi:GT2 family glycosyltransferase
MIVSAVILSNTKSDSIYQTTLECIDSLVTSETNFIFEIILIESNQEIQTTDYHFPENVQLIQPNEPFNFHRFLNIGIDASSGEFIGLFNNDLIFKKGWMTEVYKVSQEYPTVQSFCPVDFNSKFTPESFFEDRDYLFGYEVRKHVVGWCILVKKELFKTFTLDERFDFYFADDDYSLSLKKHNIKHAVVRKSNVIHLENMITKEFKKEKDDFFKVDVDRKDIPKELLKLNSWILEDEKLLDGYIRFHKKWGSRRSLKVKNKIFEILTKLKLTKLGYFLYSSK